VRWKRLVIDEGHVSGKKMTNLTTFAERLSVERRWIVTGTPTTHLLGLSLGQAATAESSRSFDTEDEGVEVEELLLDDDSDTQSHVWAAAENEDLHKLATMMHDFLRMPVFHDSNTFKKLVSTPLRKKSGPAPGAVKLFTQVLQSIMLRHR
jgi:hypothetical protein